uniref:Defective in cullin neddylation protein n=1 Tax=Globodera rostochiensis TaxID=31243 RepID=A0A914HKQ2_GLORO
MTAAMTPAQQQSIFTKLSATLTSHQSQSEQKLAQMRAAYSENGTAKNNAGTSLTPDPLYWTSSHSLSSLPPQQKHSKMLDTNNDSRCRRASIIANCLPSPSIMELAKSAGLLSLNPSDLVFESSLLGIAYYDFVLSVSEVELAHEQQQQQQQNHSPHTSPSKKPLAKRRVHETGSAPVNRTPNNTSAQGVLAVQRKRGQTIEKGGRSLVTMLQKQRTEQLLNTKNIKLSSVIHNFEKCSMSEIQEKCDTEIDATTNSSTLPTTEADKNTIFRIFLAKFDTQTNVQWFESVLVPKELLERNGIPVSELSLLTMGILVWRCTLNNARLLCLVNGVQQQLHEDSSTTIASFEALKRAACKYKCMHHVLTISQRRPSVASTHSSCSNSSRRSSCASVSRAQTQADTGMKLRILMCQSRSELPEVPSQAIRETKYLLAPSSNPLLCLCFPLT